MSPKKTKTPKPVRSRIVRTLTSDKTAEFAGWAAKRLRVPQSTVLDIGLRLLCEVLEEHYPEEYIPQPDTGEYDFDELPE